MKYLTSDGDYWVNVENQIAAVGLTQKAIMEYGVCLVISAKIAPGQRVRAGMPVIAFETIHRLGCLTSPIEGQMTAANGQPHEHDPILLQWETPLFILRDVTTIPSTLIQQQDNNNEMFGL